MPGPHAARYKDFCTGHGCYPPRPNDEASPNVFVNRLGWHRQGDHWEVHCCPPCHDSNLFAGSSTVFVNRRPAGRKGDPVHCGSLVRDHSPNVTAGGAFMDGDGNIFPNC